MAAVPRVTGVTVLGHYRLRVEFSDGVVRDVDLHHLQGRGPVFESLDDPAFFSRVTVAADAGTVVWPNGADLDPVVLHGDCDPAPPRRIA